jgi:hypothetical protein
MRIDSRAQTFAHTRATQIKSWASKKCALEWVKLFFIIFVISCFMSDPKWAIQVQGPNFMKSFEARFLDQSPPYPTFVYSDAYPSVLNVPAVERIFWCK